MLRLLLSDKKGNVFAHPELAAPVFDGRSHRLPQPLECAALPSGSALLRLPGHMALGWDVRRQRLVCVERWEGKAVFPVAAHPVPGFLRLGLPSALRNSKNFIRTSPGQSFRLTRAQKRSPKVVLPLWPYTAVGWSAGKIYACLTRVDSLRRQQPFYYKRRSLMEHHIAAALKKFPHNRLFSHLIHCAREYNCRNAQDLFLKRWEAPLPVAPSCNARCLGCLSFQETDCAEASHERITFVPTPQEIAEVALFHIRATRRPIVSFGQGCEGEPLLQFSVLREAIRLIRRQTTRGTIHCNTNGCRPRHLEALAKAGLDSVRVSLNSFRRQSYEAYYRPRGYSFEDVMGSLAAAGKSGLFTAVNFLTFPGFSDMESEAEALFRFLDKGLVDALQLRNLSMDPDVFCRTMPAPQGALLGIGRWLQELKKRFPRLRLGYFNIPKEMF